MPNIRLRNAEDLLLSIPARAFRLAEEVVPPPAAQYPDAKCVLIYEQGGRDGLATSQLKTTGPLVREMVEADPLFLVRIVEGELQDGRKVWFLPQQVVNLTGIRPPTEDYLAELEAAASFEGEPGAEPHEVITARHTLEVIKPLIGIQCRLDLCIPAGNGSEQFYTYFLKQDADEMQELIEPTPKPPTKKD